VRRRTCPTCGRSSCGLWRRLRSLRWGPGEIAQALANHRPRRDGPPYPSRRLILDPDDTEAWPRTARRGGATDCRTLTRAA